MRNKLMNNEKEKQKQREHQLRELPALYILICLLLRIDPLPRKIELKDYRIQITKQMKISIKHLDSLSQQTILLSENKINNLGSYLREESSLGGS